MYNPSPLPPTDIMFQCCFFLGQANNCYPYSTVPVYRVVTVNQCSSNLQETWHDTCSSPNGRQKHHLKRPQTYKTGRLLKCDKSSYNFCSTGKFTITIFTHSFTTTYTQITHILNLSQTLLIFQNCDEQHNQHL